MQGAIPGSELPAMFRKRREDKLRLKAQQALEGENIWKFIHSNTPDDFERAKVQAQQLNEEAEKQRAKEKEERKKAKEGLKQKKAPVATSNVEDDKKEEAEAPKNKYKYVKETDEDGFTI